MRHFESSNLALANSKSPVLEKSPWPRPKFRSRAGSVAWPKINFQPKSKSSCSRGAMAGDAAADPDGGASAIMPAARAHAERVSAEEAVRARPEEIRSRRVIDGMEVPS